MQTQKVRDFIVLGISLTHESSAALLKNGKVLAVAAEERFSRIKNDISYPRRAIDFCLRWAQVDPSELSCVVLSGKLYPYETFVYHRESQFSIDDWVHEQHAYWRPILLEKRIVSYDEAFRGRKHLKADMAYDPKCHGLPGGDILPLIKEMIVQHLKISPKLIRTVPHEQCHQYYAYFANDRRKDGLVLTCEGSGDYSNATTSVVRRHLIEQKSFTKRNHLGHMYRYSTLILGMKPNEHEYKVMGLAPYANEKERTKVYKKLSGMFRVLGLNVVLNRHMADFYFTLRDLFEGCRFDGIAGGVQMYLEEMLREWVRTACTRLSVDSVYFSGGIAQNIKACKAIAELPEVDTLSVMPISGDGSVALGAAYLVTAEHLDRSRILREHIEALTNVYLGPAYSTKQIDTAINRKGAGKGYHVVFNPGDSWVADQLMAGKIIARFSGRMEFGQRALGNRSILADPRDHRIVDRLNSSIKHRDFWMPFTPTILAERAASYIKNPKKLTSPYMTMAFDSTSKAQQELPATLHPADKTVRPQILKEAKNPGYYNLIRAFERKTGIGALLNTSFNLHGEPIVCSPEDALDVFNRSGIDILLFDHVAFCRT